MREALSERALTFACQRVEEFAEVNVKRTRREKAEAIKVWLDYLGLEDERYNQFADWLDSFLGPGWDGPVLIGFAVGLLVNQYNSGNA